jgi:hypothetical protein
MMERSARLALSLVPFKNPSFSLQPMLDIVPMCAPAFAKQLMGQSLDVFLSRLTVRPGRVLFLDFLFLLAHNPSIFVSGA